MSQNSHSCGKATVNSFGWHKLVGQSFRESLGQGKQVDGVSDMTLTCRLCGSVGGGFSKGTMASAHLSVWEKAVPQFLP